MKTIMIIKILMKKNKTRRFILVKDLLFQFCLQFGCKQQDDNNDNNDNKHNICLKSMNKKSLDSCIWIEDSLVQSINNIQSNIQLQAEQANLYKAQQQGVNTFFADVHSLQGGGCISIQGWMGGGWSIQVYEGVGGNLAN